MAAMTTVLTEFSDSGNSRTYSLANHSVTAPEIVVQKRRVPTGNQVVAEDSVDIVFATTDADSVALSQRVSFKVTVKRPITGQSTDVDDALAVFRDIIAGDEFGNTVNTQEYLV